MPQVGIGAVLGLGGGCNVPARTLALKGGIKQAGFKTRCPPGQCAIGIEHKAAPFKDDFVLPTHQVRVHQRQARGLCACAHGGFALAALARVKGRGIEHQQHLGPGLLRLGGGLLKPSILANHQAQAQTLARGGLDLKHAGVKARYEIAPLVKHLVVGQLPLGIGVGHLTSLQHAGRVVQARRRNTALAYCLGGAGRDTRRVPHHDRKAIEVCRLPGDVFKGIITRIQEGRTQKQVFCGIATNGQLRR